VLISQEYNPNTIADALTETGIQFERDVPLNSCTTFRIGGPADFLVEADTVETMSDVVRFGRENAVPVLCLGGGSNVLVSDRGVSGIVVVNRVDEASFDADKVTLGAGSTWDDVVAASVDKGLNGFVSMSGIPGSVGGAIYGNAGAYGQCVGDALESVRVVTPDGLVRDIPSSGLSFGYRESILKTTGDIIVEATFVLSSGDTIRLAEERATILQTRESKHPSPSEPTAGSFFKNIDDNQIRSRLIHELGLPDSGHRIAAGLLLDKVGARGHREGDAQVFEKHANIIVNRGDATASDVLALSRWMQDRVHGKFSVHLEPEVIWFGRPDETTNDRGNV
jgi:UDP-N-acetylmuramate dehydrogenase